MTQRIYAALTGAFLIGAAASAQADVVVSFTESAPRDLFKFTNAGNCPLPPSTIQLDLTTSKAGLLFDTDADGPGVEVFQPFETNDPKTINATAKVKDGDRKLIVRLNTLAPGSTATFTIDVDDTLTDSSLGQIRVSDSEIEGATLELTQDGATPIKAAFGQQAKARLLVNSCVS